LILREEAFAQFVLGLLASALAPAAAVILLLTLGRSPMLGWGSVWQWLVMTLCGAAATPVLFRCVRFAERCLNYQPAVQSSFRPDREIRRGRK
jgi:hypothetical protein